MKTTDQILPRSCCEKYKELEEIQTQQGKQDTEPNNNNEHSLGISCTERNRDQHFLGSYDDAPHYMRDNAYIHSGYRINFNTYKKSLKSCFMFSNNEFSNIWSHFIGIVIAFSLIVTISSFIVKNDDGIIKKTISQLDAIYESHTSQMLMQNMKEENQKQSNQLNSLLNMINQQDNYIDQIKEFETMLQEIVILSQTLPITKEQSSKINQIYSNLKAKITKELQSDNLDWVDVYKIFGIERLEEKDRRASDPKQISKWPIFFYLLSAITCFSGSVLFHTFNSVSAKHWDFLLRVDYAGICFIIAGGCIPIIYYGFYCDSGILYFYLTLTSFFCLSVFIISLFDFVHSEKYRSFKGLLYGSLGLSAAIPLTHLLFRSSYIGQEETDYLSLSSSFPFYMLTGLSLFSGLGIYLARCPERFYPGKFDRIGNSHNIWHACVVLGVFFGYIGALENYYTRKQTFCYLK